MKISQKKKKQLPPAANKWDEIVNSTVHDAMLVVDKNFIIVKANAAFERLIGQHLNGIMGRKCFEVMHGAAEPPSWCLHLECFKSQVPAIKPIFEPHLGLHLHISVSIMRNNEGAVAGSIHVLRNMTDMAFMGREDSIRFNQWLERIMRIVASAIAEVNEHTADELKEMPQGRKIHGIFIDIKTFLERSDEFLKQMAVSLSFSGIEERCASARHLHGMTKRLAMFSHEIRKLESKLENRYHSSTSISDLTKALIQISRNAHRLARRLDPNILKEKDLQRIIEKECSSFSLRAGVQVKLDFKKMPYSLSGMLVLGITSIFLELLSGTTCDNTQVIIVTVESRGESMILSVTGKGIDCPNDFSVAGYGFSAIPEWVRVLKGTIMTENSGAGGNRITLQVPLLARQSLKAIKLSGRRKEVLHLLSDGCLVKQIANILGISPKTVEFHKYRMMKDFGAKSVAELIRVAVKNKLITP